MPHQPGTVAATPPVAAEPGAAAAALNTHPHNPSKKKIFKVIYTFLHLR